MKRRMLSLVTALALCLSLCPGAALAAEGNEPPESAVPPENALAKVRLPGGATTCPTTEAEFQAVFEDNATAGAETTVTLLKDVDLTGTIRIYDGTFTLDLNGKNINFTGWSFFSVSCYGPGSSSGGSLTICGSGTVHGENHNPVQVDTNATVTLAGGTFSTGEERAVSVYVQGGGTLNVSNAGVEISHLSAGNGSIVALTAGKYGAIETSNTEFSPGRLLESGYAYYQDGKPVELKDLPGYKLLTGPFTVDRCEHPGIKATPNEGGGTHSGKCDYCSYAAEAEPCSYGTEYQHDENSHWLTCTATAKRSRRIIGLLHMTASKTAAVC